MKAHRAHSSWVGRCWPRDYRGHATLQLDPSYRYGQGLREPETIAGAADDLLAGLESFRRLTQKVLVRYSGFDEHDARLYVHYMLDKERREWSEQENLHGPFWLPRDVLAFARYCGYRETTSEWEKEMLAKWCNLNGVA